MTSPLAVSRHHVLAVIPLLPDLPSHLVKTLMCLCAHANHLTGRSFPAEKGIAAWNIPYSTFHRHCQQLAKRGLIKQVVRGNSYTHEAAEFELLFVEPLASESPTTTKGEGTYKSAPNNPEGGAPTSENGRRDPWPGLTAYEQDCWEQFAATLMGRLDASERATLIKQSKDFDMLIPLKRTAVRLVHNGKGRALLEALTEQAHPGQPVYAGAKNVTATLFQRLRLVADNHQVHVWDRREVTGDTPTTFQAGWTALGLDGVRIGQDVNQA
jgi:hypothetical protein